MSCWIIIQLPCYLYNPDRSSTFFPSVCDHQIQVTVTANIEYRVNDRKRHKERILCGIQVLKSLYCTALCSSLSLSSFIQDHVQEHYSHKRGYALHQILPLANFHLLPLRPVKPKLLRKYRSNRQRCKVKPQYSLTQLTRTGQNSSHIVPRPNSLFQHILSG